MRILLLVDQDAVNPFDPECRLIHGDSSDDNCRVAEGLRRLGHVVAVRPFVGVAETMSQLGAFRPALVFNSTDAVGDDRTKAPHIAALLELLDVPYTGSGPFAQALTTDKERSKCILAHHGVPVPWCFRVDPGSAIPVPPSMPVFVKPLFGGAKEFIAAASLARTAGAMSRRVQLIHRATGQPALCEEYVDGRELTASLLETPRGLLVPAIREMRFNGIGDAAPKFATHRVMEDAAYRTRWKITMVDAQLAPRARQAIETQARTAFRVLALAGYARLDLRLGPDGISRTVEVNANPALRPPTASFLSPWGRVSYPRLLSTIVSNAMQRAKTRAQCT